MSVTESAKWLVNCSSCSNSTSVLSDSPTVRLSVSVSLIVGQLPLLIKINECALIKNVFQDIELGYWL